MGASIAPAMNRRAFVTGLGAVLAVPLGAEAQQRPNIPRIGVLSFGQSPTGTVQFNPNDGFREGLRNLDISKGAMSLSSGDMLRHGPIAWRPSRWSSSDLTSTRSSPAAR